MSGKGKGGVILSEKHGVNPTIPVCMYCGKQKNQIILLGKLPGDKKAPSNTVFNDEPCEDCASMMKEGVMICEVADGSDRSNPDRTGFMIVISDEAASKYLKIDTVKFRYVFAEQSSLKAMLGQETYDQLRAKAASGEQPDAKEEKVEDVTEKETSHEADGKEGVNPDKVDPVPD